jgi:negative regulator of sigma E activity
VRPLVSFFLLFFLFSSFAWGQNNAFQLLDKVVQQQTNLTYEGIKIIVHWYGKNVSVHTARILKEKGNELFQYLPIDKHPYQEVLISQKKIYYVNPSKKIVLWAPFSYHGPKEKAILQLAFQNYTWDDEGKDNFIGYRVEKISATPKGANYPAARFWVCKNPPVILREERYDSSTGNPYFTSYFSYIVFPHRIDHNFFEIPFSYRLIRLKTPEELEGESALKALDFKPLMPRFIPDGFVLVGTYLTRFHPHGKLELLYSDGLRDFTIYEELRHGPYHKLKDSVIVHVNGHYVEFFQGPGGKLIRFAQGPLTITVVGSLPGKTMASIALSIATPAPMHPQTLTSKLFFYFLRGLAVVKKFFVSHL